MFISLFACVKSDVSPSRSYSAPRMGSLCVCVCVPFTEGLTLPIKFSVPAVNFIGGVKARLGCVCIFSLSVRLSVEIMACKDKMHRSSKYVTEISLIIWV